MFRGTPTNPLSATGIMTKAGARDNASTGDDATHYYSTFAKKIETSLASTPCQHLSLPKPFQDGSASILGEQQEQEPLRSFEVQREKFYQAHTYKHTTMGSTGTSIIFERARIGGVFRALVCPRSGDHRRRCHA